MRFIPEKSWLLPFLEVKDSKIHGKGLFTNSHIDIGTTVIIWGGMLVSVADFKAGKGQKHTNVGIDDNLFLVALNEDNISSDDYMNHSCNPNLWLADEITLTARRDIKAGEELTIDYAFELADENYVMKNECNCHEKTCRKIVTGRDWRLPSLHNIYGDHFSPFINRRIQKLKSTT